eukprot:365282-Chlamydomonas_euryale.AAC.7
MAGKSRGSAARCWHSTCCRSSLDRRCSPDSPLAPSRACCCCCPLAQLPAERPDLGCSATKRLHTRPKGRCAHECRRRRARRHAAAAPVR